jgi:phage terminase large subunit-like protein
MASRKTPSTSSSKAAPRKKAIARAAEIAIAGDEATAYALSVVEGREIAGPIVRDACARHLKDLKEGHKRGLVWSTAHVDRVLRFCRNILKLNGGEFEGKPFDPLPWQAFILGNLFGWLRLQDKTRYASVVITDKELAEELEAGNLYRRFRVAYQETGKGSGKSPLAAAVGLYMLVADGEERAEVYAAATKRDQAMILFRDAVAMVDQSPALSKAVKKSGRSPNVWNLLYGKTNSFFRPISSDDGQSGPRPSCALVDEFHEHKGPQVIEMLKAGFKFRKQPLLFVITNSGTDTTSACYDYHEYGAKVCAGTLDDDEFFAYICAHDKGEDPFADEACWPKTNPSLGKTFTVDYLRSQVTPARSMPSKESTVRRLNFCQWVGSNDPWLTSEVWNRNIGPVRPRSALRGATFYAGLDLSMKNDLSALILLFPREDEFVESTRKNKHGEEEKVRYNVCDVHCFFWAPEEGILEKEKKDRVPYTAWARAGHIELVPGPVIDYSFIAYKLRDLIDEHDLGVLMFDRYRIKDLQKELKDIGLEWPEDESPLVEHGQGFAGMSPSIELTEDMLARGTLRTADHPVLKWCVGNAIVEKDPAELRKFNKARATGRIDGAVALCMAARATQGREDNGDLDDFLNNPIVLG